jgi:drug/metabolite transporter (DMT)-like permease
LNAISPRWRLLVGAVVISFSPVLVKTAAFQGLGPTAIAFWRTGIGGLFLAGLALATGRSLRLDRRSLALATSAGLFFFGDLFCWHRSIVYAGSGMATILGNTQVFFTALVATVAFRERLSLRFGLSALVAFGGLVLLVGVGSAGVSFTPEYQRGIVFGLATGLAYAGYLVSLKKGGQRADGPDLVAFMAWASIFSAIGLGTTAAFEAAPLWPGDLGSVASLVGLGVGVQGLAWLVITATLPRIPTAQAGLILLLQPILATGWGMLFFDERLEVVQVVGAAITLAAMYAGASARRS